MEAAVTAGLTLNCSDPPPGRCFLLGPACSAPGQPRRPYTGFYESDHAPRNHAGPTISGAPNGEWLQLGAQGYALDVLSFLHRARSHAPKNDLILFRNRRRDQIGIDGRIARNPQGSYGGNAKYAPQEHAPYCADFVIAASISHQAGVFVHCCERNFRLPASLPALL